jgi:hypothetical protein
MIIFIMVAFNDPIDDRALLGTGMDISAFSAKHEEKAWVLFIDAHG